ncbi:unnamed protein product [Symbiodinium natans]|uniref:Uncharacterized protein n=1 Tax=Symbiodinium natans TaxID=878477 RepID=A0A812JXI8_9DINO|nr:unnamed protein product [Symbiodinium natans]
MAFVQQHVREGTNGPEVILSNNMCQDRHVDDLLLCIESWLVRQYGRSGAQPWQLGTLDLSRNGLSDENVARIADRLRQLHVRVRCLDLTANKAGTKGLLALEAYLWNCSEPFQEISLAENEICVEAGSGEDNPVSSFLRCLYNHPSYPRKTSSDAGALIHPLVLRLRGNKIPDLQHLLKEIQRKVGDKAHFCSSPEAYHTDAEEFLSVHISDVESVESADSADSAAESAQQGEGAQGAEAGVEAEDSAWQRRQRRRKAKELALKESSPKSDQGEQKKKKKARVKNDEGKKKKAKKENGKTKKKKKKRSKQDESKENGDQEAQPASEEATEEGEDDPDDEDPADEQGAEQNAEQDAEGTNDGVSSEKEADEVKSVEKEPPEDPRPEAVTAPPMRTFCPTALSLEDQASLKKETVERLRQMEGLLDSIGESALTKLAELTVRLLASGKRSEDMLMELKPFARALIKSFTELRKTEMLNCLSRWASSELRSWQHLRRKTKGARTMTMSQ